MSFIQELKRRNVFRVGIAYAVTTWILLQLTDVLSQMFTLPDWAPKLILLILIVGLIPALIFAWAFEMTPDGIKKEKDVDRSQSIAPQTGKKLNHTITILMALAIGYLLYDKFSAPAKPGSESFSQQTTQQTTASKEKTPLTPGDVAQGDATPDAVVTKPTRQSIAVLPFDNRSKNEDDEFFVAGMHDDLLTNLARIGSLKVISRTSVSQYKNTEKTIPVIAKELGVATIMEGAVQRSGNTVRINVQLIDAQTDEHLWAEIYDRKLTAENLFAIQSEISHAIAKALEATLSPAEQQRISTRPTENLTAYDAYLRGRQLMAVRRSAELEQAIEQFQKAVDLDPGFALAWAGLADSNLLLSSYGTLPVEAAILVQEEAVNKALAIDPDIGEIYASLGQIHQHYDRPQEAEAAYQKAIELSPNYATAYHWYANFLVNYNSRAGEAVDLARKAVELDPRSAIIGGMLAVAYEVRGLFSLAQQQLLKTIELNPDFSQAYVSLGYLYIYELGRFDQGVEYASRAAELDPGNLNPLDLLANAYHNLGDAAATEATIRRMEELDANNWLTAFTNVPASLMHHNPAGTQEAINWALPKLRVQPFYARIIGQVQLQIGDIQKARRIYLAANPGWMTASEWPGLIDQGTGHACTVAWILMRTGDEAIGASLLKQTLAYYENILPGAIEHADLKLGDICYLAAGKPEKALALIETQVEHGHLFLMNETHALPMYDQIRTEPRYLAAMAKRESKISAQRDTLAQTKAETAP